MNKMPKQIKKVRTNRVASAPYNFVPLPEKVIPTHDLPDHDGYDPDRHSGYFEVELTTKSPLYIRGMLTQQEYEYSQSNKYIDGEPLPKQGKPKFRCLPKNKPEFFHTHNSQHPVIPGSSLRGMLRNLFEIITYSKMKWVTDTHKIFYRTVAAKKDPLSQIYQNTMEDVRVGYLVKKLGRWYIKPAKTTKEVNTDLEAMYFFKVRSYFNIKGSNVEVILPNYFPLGDKKYRPNYHPVSYQLGEAYYTTKKDHKVEFYGPIKIDTPSKQLPYKGVLVCAGPTNRKNVILVPECSDKEEIEINQQAVRDYLDALTTFQKEKPYDETYGALIEGKPIFYVHQEGEEEIFFFGHTPNFRLPAWHKAEERAITPRDFVPPSLNQPTVVDYTEAVFGFTRTQEEIERIGDTVGIQGDKQQAYASRLFVTSASINEQKTDITDIFEADITPSILATPKPTTFQHYLTQDSDELEQLKHYGSSTDKTTIRGHKLYWHQGERSIEQMKPAPNSPNVTETGEVEIDSTQHTNIKPVKAGVTFTFRIYFEDLSDKELGALCWTLAPYGDDQRKYYHRLGMAKPLGMGSVALKATLYKVKKEDYYQKLFRNSQWNKGEEKPLKLCKQEVAQTLIQPFEKDILEQLQVAGWAKHLYELQRIAILLKMLEWPGQTAETPATLRNRIKQDDTPNTRYMEIRIPPRKNEFRGRPVLPSPVQFGNFFWGRVKWSTLLDKEYTAKIISLHKSMGAILDINEPEWNDFQLQGKPAVSHMIDPKDVPSNAHKNMEIKCKIVDMYDDGTEIIVQYKPIAKSHKRRK